MPSRKNRAPTLGSRLRWASARIGFHAYIGFSLITVVGGFLTAPLMSWLFFDDWRFWKHWQHGMRMFRHGWKMAFMVLRGENSGFMLAVPLSSPPLSEPNPDLTYLNPTWEHGSACGPCSRCCDLIECPILEQDNGLCRGYQSFFWRYFNCGRFPVQPSEIDYYGCPKWLVQGQQRRRKDRAAAA